MSKPVVHGQSELIARMRRISANLPEIIGGDQVQNLLLRRVRERFERSVSPDGTKWPRLEDSTVRRKKYLGVPRPEKALERSGRLRDSIAVIRGITTGLLVANTGIGFRIGVNDPLVSEYGRMHNYGEGQRQRRFIGISYLDTESVRGLVARRLKAKVNKK